MIRTIKTGLAFAGLAGLFLLQAPASAQDKMKPDTMKQDDMKNEKMQDDKMMHEFMAKTLFTGKFHGKYMQLRDARRCIKRRTGDWCCG